MEISVTPSGSCDEMMKRLGREHTGCLKMPDNGHSYIGPTAYSFKKFIRDRLGDVYDCYVLLSSSLNEPLKPFQGIFHLPLSTKVMERSAHSLTINRHLAFMMI